MASLSEIVSEKKHLAVMQASVFRLHCDALDIVSTGLWWIGYGSTSATPPHPRGLQQRTPPGPTHAQAHPHRTRSRSRTSTRPATLVTPRIRPCSSEADIDTSSADSLNPDATLSSPSVVPALVNGTHDQPAPARRRHHHHSRTSRSGLT